MKIRYLALTIFAASIVGCSPVPVERAVGLSVAEETAASPAKKVLKPEFESGKKSLNKWGSPPGSSSEDAAAKMPAKGSAKNGDHKESILKDAVEMKSKKEGTSVLVNPCNAAIPPSWCN